MSSKPPPTRQVPANRVYFGRMVGSPPGLPGGGITGVLPASGVGAWISGSIPAGGHNTPSDFASLSPSGSARWPVVVPSGETAPRGGTGCIGAQPVAAAGTGWAVWAGGVADAGGACAIAREGITSSAPARKSACFIRMRGKRPIAADVPRERRAISGFAVAD
jgi:hypothetical protein